MSLLIDALRKAEEQKRRAEPEALPAPPPAGGGKPAPDAQSARNLFEVKASRRTLGFPLLVGGLTTLASLGIGIYFWLQLHPPGPRLTSAAPVPAAMPTRPSESAARPVPTAPPASPGAEARATDHAPVVPARRAEPVATGGESPARTGQAEGLPPRPSARPVPTESPKTVDVARGPVIRHGSTPTVAPDLAGAWSSYRAGDLEQARRLYQRVLAADGRNADALNGLASIAARSGRPADAVAGFRRTLIVRPDDAVALAGLSALGAGESDEPPSALVSRLRTALAERPDEAALHFALGNALAAEQRWAEAQSRYFAAYGLDASNPDYLFNLGVSLDHLGQRPLARRFYDEALRAAASRSHAFDRATALARLGALGGPPPREPGHE